MPHPGAALPCGRRRRRGNRPITRRPAPPGRHSHHLLTCTDFCRAPPHLSKDHGAVACHHPNISSRVTALMASIEEPSAAEGPRTCRCAPGNIAKQQPACNSKGALKFYSLQSYRVPLEKKGACVADFDCIRFDWRHLFLSKHARRQQSSIRSAL